ncbi:YifB family Mg chelatase-like AAA ATPase [Nocardioides agariphilus]|jgi:magnesium chelatase family protein|uniref:YifB family Mg chelatase-like AAA ATPase n=1 Tax=Nocardioides agariphilus TaxID=433664 RepID=A0A930VM16_9ACTN|nr:YifB family Mg chelatase-like AAA ATPase [Nocardioides agariphilus]MBF4769984.1 YifB family Mg chelatase-like AAA ATPase [Nocardioides agariphilus]
MSVATAHATWLQGAQGHLIEVQADVSNGVVGTTVVGRADVAINEARERCRMAVVNSGLEWPGTKRITILLSPADLAKRGTHFDLAIAVAVLAAYGKVKTGELRESLFIGELTLSGGLRSVPGVLPMVLAASRHGIRQVFVPEPQVREAAMVPGMVVFGMRSLAQVSAQLNDEPVPDAPPVAGLSPGDLLTWRGQSRLDELDLIDVDGVADAKYAIEVAAAGGHHLMLIGPKGAGKTTLAERLPGLLPDLTPEESLELTALHSLAGALVPGDDLIVRPPFFAPHHDVSKVGLLGGGSGRVRPGDVSRAHNGVLFLDEFPLFRSDVIESLRQPLESGEVTITRGEDSATYPARGLVVMACNPCPCGNYHPQHGRNRCECLEPARKHYRAKITGPITDRVDITRQVEPALPHERNDRFALRETSELVRLRVSAARARQHERYSDRSWRLNSQAPGPVLQREWPLAPELQHKVDDEIFRGRLTRRGATRVHRLAWTIADLDGVDAPGFAQLDAAIRLRSGEPLLDAHLRRRAAG